MMPISELLDLPTLADPWPHYAQLRAQGGLLHDPQRGLWVASRAEDVAAVLTHPACRVRPTQEPVPTAIAGSPAGEVFRWLVRMNDATPHPELKPLLQQHLARLDLQRVAALCQARVRDQRVLLQGAAGWQRLASHLPVQLVGELLGFAPAQAACLPAWIAAFVACLSPLSTTTQLQQASDAATQLSLAMDGLMQQPLAEGTPLAALQQAMRAVPGLPDAARHANLLGLLSQTYEATAALIGHAALACRQAGVPLHDPARDWMRWVVESARCYGPVQNTRRFVVEDAEVAGQRLPAGAVILVLLAAAQRDPAANPEPDRFWPERPAPRLFGFGQGAHACPGQALAFTLASSLLREAVPLPMPALPQSVSFLRSLNGRIPDLRQEGFA
ncbi:cytochrome P450 [Leeia aquatica]|uniref:Cytochrome P450 n=1 Tax=Leeia aquatica TaxID=2725557 RepID=A0A847SC05_9NEIS|nr:cytochrome P450 [Leeia aquatica]NLR74879.1 cytochrome P450 [Leeia aquatica]